ncbi:ATP-binding cassette subfamily B protein [Neolewinella xylanilytica]|uniref:ATP-binding cassette subfamily B protein n=1 Tax=Neolewinella xylanilytica TaxID=1514080 RepID=A0A2S6I421_9BACT|nr:peptidase domain-containing ABC transporter [Neolewinella xylanilytica]PPK85809.1 ATP-binding cassette subfamily B protein [Neolewinella xylanilytica]
MKKTIKQHDITDCGAACLASIAAHYQLALPIARIRQMASTDQKGTNLLGMIQAAEKLGFTCQGVRAEEDAFKNEAPFPAVAHVIVNKRLHHFVVVYRVTDKYVQVMDPANGRMQKKSWKTWREEWTGVLLLIAPGDDFKAGDRRVSTFARFRALLQPHRSTLLQALVGAVVYTVLGLSTSIYLQKITDFVLINQNTRLLNLLSIAMVALLGMSIFIGTAKSVMVMKSGQLIDARLILGYYKHLLRLPQRFFDTMRTGEIISRIGDAVKIRAFINDVAINLLVNVFIVVFSFGLMFTYYWKLALVLLIVIPCYVAIYWVTNRMNRSRERELMERAADLESQLVESVNAVRTIKQLGLEDHANRKTETRFVKLLQTTYRSGMTGIFSGNASELVSRLFTIILLWVGSYYVIEGAISPGELLGFYALIGYFTGPARGLIGMNKTIQNALIAADRLFEIIDLESEEEAIQGMELKREMIGDIRFRGLAFSYGSRKNVFEGFDLTIPAGQITGLVGGSGSGKSTLAALLQKLYPPTAGKVVIGDADLAYVTNQSLRARIGVVPQELSLFAGNLIENIAVGDYAPDMQRILSICKELGLLPFIETLPEGFATYVGEHGATLSGGQRQRLAIARALYRDPDILILDEATSALDSASEEFVQRTIHRLRAAGKTIIIIAHRLSTIMDADKIAVLEEGKLIQEGTHDELLAGAGAYRELWNKQFPSRVVRRLAA